MKLKQILLVSFSVTSIILIALFIHSCNSDYEQISPSLTRADELVASTEFQEFQETTEHFAESLRKKYVKLSKSDQDQFVKTLSKLSDPNIENSKELLEKANSIIGTNLELEQKKIREKSSFLNHVEHQDISQKDLITAIKRQGLGSKNTTIRLKSGNEEDPKQACKDNCSVQFVGCAAIAAMTPPPGDVAAFAICVIMYNSCLGTC